MLIGNNKTKLDIAVTQNPKPELKVSSNCWREIWESTKASLRESCCLPGFFQPCGSWCPQCCSARCSCCQPDQKLDPVELKSLIPK